MTDAKLTFQGQVYNVSPITDYHIQFLASLYKENGLEIDYNLEKHSQVLKLIFEYICPALPKRFVKINPNGDYYWVISLQEFAALLVAIASCYATYFDPQKTISDENKKGIDDAAKLLDAPPIQETMTDEELDAELVKLEEESLALLNERKAQLENLKTNKKVAAV